MQPQAATLQLCFGRSDAVASIRAMVKQGGSETAEKDGSKLFNVAHPRCQRSIHGRGCYPACGLRVPARHTETHLFFKRVQNMFMDLFR